MYLSQFDNVFNGSHVSEQKNCQRILIAQKKKYQTILIAKKMLLESVKGLCDDKLISYPVQMELVPNWPGRESVVESYPIGTDI